MKPSLCTLLALYALLGPAFASSAHTQNLSAAPHEHRTLAPASEESRGELALRQALALALQHNPELSAYSLEIRAAEAAALQAAVLPNPVLSYGSENLGNARLRAAGDRAHALELGQLVELGGKRSARLRYAYASRDVAACEYEAKRIEVLTRVAQHFVDVLAAQAEEGLTSESVELAMQATDAVARRVQAGRVSPVEETRARVAESAVRVERDQARRRLAAARLRLSTQWGNPQPRFSAAVGRLDRVGLLPEYPSLAQRVRDNPDFVRWFSEIQRRSAALDIERSKAISDVTVLAGVRRYSEFDDQSYTVGISLPLPLFNRNRGGILEASRRLDKASEEQRGTELRLLAELGQSYERVRAIRAELDTLQASILPGARSAYESALKGYQLGRFGFLEVLDAQRTLFQARAQQLRALADYRRGLIEIERLTGAPLDAPSAMDYKDTR